MFENDIENQKREEIRERIAREKDSIKTCAEWILYYVDKFQDAGVPHFTSKEVMSIIKITNGYKGDIIVFQNGSSPFDVWTNEKPGAIKALAESDHLKGYVFCSRIDGVDKIINHTWIPNHYYDPKFYENEGIL